MYISNDNSPLALGYSPNLEPINKIKIGLDGNKYIINLTEKYKKKWVKYFYFEMNNKIKKNM